MSTPVLARTHLDAAVIHDLDKLNGKHSIKMAVTDSEIPSVSVLCSLPGRSSSATSIWIAPVDRGELLGHETHLSLLIEGAGMYLLRIRGMAEEPRVCPAP